ncbi:ATP-binding cassette domain-containing protein [Krasilnikoviella flava]|uniref:Energy-coupling factor transport system ATP-binding protein n=1 Tax=Krasilnikoviella flava TaxID=526729 RepID=A0A1T5KV95_9MICO|nr:ABC transporter ATP-binding protein [Krasilnikoviella flava]SKC67319.1 energy-coupling factor transport system ATP-binding protein [Krasilnikoviella flava]
MASREVRARLRGLRWRPIGRATPALDDLDLTIGAGERIGLVGPSGAGKSTVLHALAGVLGEALPGELSGTVHVDGAVGLVLQDPGAAVVAGRIGRDVAFGPENAGLPRDEIWRRTRHALDRVGLRYPLERPTSALSGGELHRLALAGALARAPGLLLLDEPTAMLDPEAAAEVRAAVVGAIDGTDTALVVVDHHVGPWLEHLDRVVVLGPGGRIMHEVSPGALHDGAAAGPRDELTRAGVWLPGVPPPAPLDVPASLVVPDAAGPEVAVDGLVVDLTTRGLRGRTSTRALAGVDARLPAGRLTAVTGPSGAGKSALVAALAGHLRPAAGGVRGAPSRDARSRELARACGWVPQHPEHGLLALRVRDEVELTGRRLGVPVDVEAVLGLLRLDHLVDAHPFRLSGGEQRRLALAAALAHRPGLVLLDEPTVGQDRRTWAAVAGWATAAARHGATVAASTHDADLVALADHRVRLGRDPLGSDRATSPGGVVTA